MHKVLDRWWFSEREGYGLIYNDFKEIGNILFNDLMKENQKLTDLDIIYNTMIDIGASVKNSKEQDILDRMIYLDINSETNEIAKRMEYLTKEICIDTNLIKKRTANFQFPYFTGSADKMLEVDKKKVIKFFKHFSMISEEKRKKLDWKSLKKIIEPHFEFNLTEEECIEFLDLISIIDNKEVQENIVAILQDEVCKSKSNGYLTYYCISIDSKILAKTNYYKYYTVLRHVIEGTKFKKNICSCCTKEKATSPKLFGKLPAFKFYTITNKAFGADGGNFAKSSTICIDCFIRIYLFMNNSQKYRGRFKGDSELSFITYPTFLIPPSNYQEVENIAQKAVLALRGLENPLQSNLKNWRIFEDECIDDGLYYYINTIAYKQEKSSTNVKFNVPNIQSGRLLEILRKSEIHGRHYRQEYGLSYDFNFIRELKNYILLDGFDYQEDKTKKKSVDNHNYRNYLQILNCILLNQSIPRERITDILLNKLASANNKAKDEDFFVLYQYTPRQIFKTLNFLEDINLIPKIKEEKGLILELLEKVKDESRECNNIYEFAIKNEVYNDDRLFFIMLGYMASYIEYLQGQKNNKGIIKNANLLDMDIYSIKLFIEELLDKYNVYREDTFYYSHFIKILLLYISEIEDMELSNSDRVIAFFLGVSLRLSSVHKKNRPKEEDYIEEIEEDIEEDESEDIDEESEE